MICEPGVLSGLLGDDFKGRWPVAFAYHDGRVHQLRSHSPSSSSVADLRSRSFLLFFLRVAVVPSSVLRNTSRHFASSRMSCDSATPVPAPAVTNFKTTRMVATLIVRVG